MEAGQEPVKQALVTGGARGLGQALAVELRKRGYAVVIADVLPYEGSDPDVRHVSMDLAAFDPGLVVDLPRFDLVICNAGITAIGDYKKIDHATDRRVIEVNVLGHMALVKELLAQDKLSDGGHLALTSSASVFVPWPVAIAYATSKGALDGFALALESYLIPRKVSVTRVHPGAMRTQHGGLAQDRGVEVGVAPEKIAPKIVSGILRRKRRIFPDTMSKTLVTASRLCPRIMSRMIYKKLERDIQR